MTASAWARDAVLRRLDDSNDSEAQRAPPHAPPIGQAAGPGANEHAGANERAGTGMNRDTDTAPDTPRGPGVYRAWFDAQQTAKLDLIVARTGRRSRIKALHALLDGVPIGAPASAANLGQAVQALARSNHELVAVGRNLNQVARSLNAYPGRTTTAERMAIERVLAAVRSHLEEAARVVAELRPQLKTQPKEST
jgi:hypothetical protein